MDKPDREAEPFFTQPVRQIVIMMVCLVIVGSGVYVAFPRVAPVFLANPILNGVILAVFVIGVVACFWQVVTLVGSVSWIEGFASGRAGYTKVEPPRLLAPLAALLKSRGARMQISATSSRSILDSVAARIDEAREITRYLGSLLIFLGLLGTFYGLATTVPAVVETIRALAPQDGESSVDVFSRLMTGLESQLGGMGVAFASSLLGLAGSLVVGLLELFAGHAQNRFYGELEEWVSSITRLGYSSGDGEGAGDQGAAGMLLEHFSEQMDALQQLFTRSDVSRSLVDEQLSGLVASINRLTATMAPPVDNTALLKEIAQGQKAVVKALGPREEQGGAHVDAESRMRLRSIDVQLLRILEEMSAGRQESVADLRTDLAALTKAIRALSRETVEGRRSA